MSRDTHFSGFAKKLIDELDIETPHTEERQRWEHIIAQRAYDLVCSAVPLVNPAAFRAMQDGSMTPQDFVQRVPDMAELPKESAPLSKLDYIHREIPAQVLAQIDKPLDDIEQYSMQCVDDILGIWRYGFTFKDKSTKTIDG